MITSWFWTIAPFATLISLTVPSNSLATSFSSFIASIIATVCPFLTVSPTLTWKSTIFPPIGARIFWPPVDVEAVGFASSTLVSFTGAWIDSLVSVTASSSTS